MPLQLAAWLQAAGLPAENVVIWDHIELELRDAGSTPNRGRGVRVNGADQDYERRVREWGPSSSRFARLLVEDLT